VEGPVGDSRNACELICAASAHGQLAEQQKLPTAAQLFNSVALVLLTRSMHQLLDEDSGMSMMLKSKQNLEGRFSARQQYRQLPHWRTVDTPTVGSRQLWTIGRVRGNVGQQQRPDMSSAFATVSLYNQRLDSSSCREHHTT
jgi:hypothetical protein